MLTLGLDACYYKPIQSGSKEGTDTQAVREMTGLPYDRFFDEKIVLPEPLSPHRAAELARSPIDPEGLELLPASKRLLVVEGAGGLLVPITRELLQIDLIADMGIPVVLVSRTGLGTINHSLLSAEALRRRGIPLLGFVFVGEENEDNERTVCDLADAPRLGRVDPIGRLDKTSLETAFRKGFRAEDFLSAMKIDV